MHQELERAKIDLENSRLAMIKDGTLGCEARGAATLGSSVPRFDINNLQLLPQFNERDPDTFFLLFQRVVKARISQKQIAPLCCSASSQGRHQKCIQPLALRTVSTT